MPFNTYTFIIFFICVLIIHSSLNNWRLQKVNLLFASYLFYSAWNPVFVLLLLFSTFCDWHIARYMYKAASRSAKKKYVLLSIIINLGLLGYFKYGEFISANIIILFANLGVHFSPLESDIILPVGISFYTFQTLSYAFDVYLGKIKPGSSFLDYALYVSFFPQLVAGPIVRAGDFLPQCEKPRRASKDQFVWGVSLLIIGLFMKVIMADTLFSPIVDKIYANPISFGCIETWVAILSFSGQIFCDFGGYSTCAIGVALSMGFILPDNFNAPYSALGFQDFWRRWHISLSSWLKDYLYIGLGGNRISVNRTNINIILTMLIGGLWHGASWLFIIWGGLHGCCLVLERTIKKYLLILTDLSKITKLSLIALTYLIVSLIWVFFRAEDFYTAQTIFTNLFVYSESIHKELILSTWEISAGLFASALLFFWHIYRRHSSLEVFFSSLPPYFGSLLLFLQLFIMCFFASGDDRAFIYFQF